MDNFNQNVHNSSMLNNYSYNPYSSYSNKYAPQISSNVLRVTTLEEAVMRTTVPGSDMIYFNQDKDEFYRVRVDFEGKKSWATFEYTSPNNLNNSPATKYDLELLSQRLAVLENKLLNKESLTNGESDGQTIQ